MKRLHEISDPQGGRNVVRRGDVVKVAAGGSDRTGFLARFLYAVEEDGVLVASVYGGHGYDPRLGRAIKQPKARCQHRDLPVSRLRRKAQTQYQHLPVLPDPEGEQQ